MNKLFEEKQKFPIWILLILGPITLVPLYGLYYQVILKEPFGDNPMPTWALVIFLVLMLAMTWLFLSMNLKTTINEEGVKVRIFPFIKREIKWSEVKKAEVLKYGFVGGWGVRYSSKYGTVYNTRGNIGLVLDLNNGKKICVGTQKQTELEEVINNLQN